MRVDLTYFHHSGKYHSTGTYETEYSYMYEIFSEVRQLLVARICPGLVSNHSNFIVSIDVPDHKHNHPCLVIVVGPE